MLYQHLRVSNLIVFVYTILIITIRDCIRTKNNLPAETSPLSWFQNSEKHTLVLLGHVLFLAHISACWVTINQYCDPSLLLQLAKLLAMGRQTYIFLAWKTFSFNEFQKPRKDSKCSNKTHLHIIYF